MAKTDIENRELKKHGAVYMFCVWLERSGIYSWLQGQIGLVVML